MSAHGNINHAMRDNYAAFGVDEYYRRVAQSYRNPFFAGIKQVVWAFMGRWWAMEGGEGKRVRVLDMAAGSGEATLCLLEWETAGKRSASPEGTPAASPLPDAVQSRFPVRAPFIPPNARRSAPPSGSSSATATASPRELFRGAPPRLPGDMALDIVATDPYTSPAYLERTGRTCHPLSFTDLAGGTFPEDTEEPWDIVICSFALHLLTEGSELFALLDALSRRARWLVVVAPHKKPEIKETWGWSRWDIRAWAPAGDKLYGRTEDEESELEIVREKVKLRVYRSNALSN